MIVSFFPSVLKTRTVYHELRTTLVIFWSIDSTCLSLRAGSRRDEEEGSGGEGKVNSNLLHNIMKREGRRRFHLLYYPNEHFLSPTNWGVEDVIEFCHPYLPSAASPLTFIPSAPSLILIFFWWSIALTHLCAGNKPLALTIMVVCNILFIYLFS